MTKWLEFCRNELERAGFFSQDSDYEGALGKAVLELCEVFSRQEHSGASAVRTLQLFYRLASWKPLTPVTEGDFCTGVSKNQCARCPSVFLNADGTVRDVDAHLSVDREGMTYKGSDTPKHQAKLPYWPPTHPMFFSEDGKPLLHVNGKWFYITIGDVYTQEEK